MIEIYATKPQAVECFALAGRTDVILRRDIVLLPEAEEKDAPTGWQCEERQFRYNGRLTAKEVQTDFDRWWNYTPTEDTPPTLDNRVAALEAAQLTMMDLAMGGAVDV